MPTFKLSPTKKLILWHDILSSHNMLILINPFAVLNPYSLTNELKDSKIKTSFHPLKDASKIQIQSWSTRWIFWQKMPPNQYWSLWYFYRQNRSSHSAPLHEFYYDSQNRTKMERKCSDLHTIYEDFNFCWCMRKKTINHHGMHELDRATSTKTTDQLILQSDDYNKALYQIHER